MCPGTACKRDQGCTGCANPATPLLLPNADKWHWTCASCRVLNCPAGACSGQGCTACELNLARLCCRSTVWLGQAAPGLSTTPMCKGLHRKHACWPPFAGAPGWFLAGAASNRAASFRLAYSTTTRRYATCRPCAASAPFGFGKGCTQCNDRECTRWCGEPVGDEALSSICVTRCTCGAPLCSSAQVLPPPYSMLCSAPGLRKAAGKCINAGGRVGHGHGGSGVGRPRG